MTHANECGKVIPATPARPDAPRALDIGSTSIKEQIQRVFYLPTALRYPLALQSELHRLLCHRGEPIGARHGSVTFTTLGAAIPRVLGNVEERKAETGRRAL